jgi:hypothetical protein
VVSLHSFAGKVACVLIRAPGVAWHGMAGSGVSAKPFSDTLVMLNLGFFQVR